MDKVICTDEPIGKTLCYLLPDLQHLAWLVTEQGSDQVVICIQNHTEWQKKMPLLVNFVTEDTAGLDLLLIGNKYTAGLADREVCRLAASMSKEIAESILEAPALGMVRILLFYSECGPRILSTDILPEQRLLS
jgi:hypothetical protein